MKSVNPISQNYPIVSSTAPSITESPGLTTIDVTVPAYSASMLFCIFIASSTRTVSPTFTWSPTFTLIELIVPGRGALTGLPEPGAAAGAAATGAATGAGAGAAGLGAATLGFLIA